MYLIDTNVISEARKGPKTNPGVNLFFKQAATTSEPLYLSAISVGELRRGVELIRHRGDTDQANLLETWLTTILEQFNVNILPFDADAAQIWGRLRVPNSGHERDKQIAATALIHDLTVVTRNTADFKATGVKLRNPFAPPTCNRKTPIYNQSQPINLPSRSTKDKRPPINSKCLPF